jgi:hypothetical protein
MAFYYHTLKVGGNVALADSQEVLFVTMSATNSSGAAGATVTVTGFQNAFTDLPSSYQVFLDCGQAVVAYVTSKSNTGFTVTLVPLPTGSSYTAGSVAAGTVVAMIIG